MRPLYPKCNFNNHKNWNPSIMSQYLKHFCNSIFHYISLVVLTISAMFSFLILLTIIHVNISQVNILEARNHKSGNLEIRVPALGNHLFCAWLRFHFYGNIGQGLAAFAVRSNLYKYSCRNYDSTCTKMISKSDFHVSDRWWISLRIIQIYMLITYNNLIHSIFSINSKALFIN